MTKPMYIHTSDPSGDDEMWVKYEGPCGRLKPVSVVFTAETGYSVASNEMNIDLGDAWTKQKIKLSAFPVDWCAEAWKIFNPEENNSVFSNEAINVAFDYTADGASFSGNRAECAGTGSVPVFIWQGTGTGTAVAENPGRV